MELSKDQKNLLSQDKFLPNLRTSSKSCQWIAYIMYAYTYVHIPFRSLVVAHIMCCHRPLLVGYHRSVLCVCRWRNRDRRVCESPSESERVALMES